MGSCACDSHAGTIPQLGRERARGKIGEFRFALASIGAPHSCIHAPGTVLNDQFKGADSWEEYLAKIESATPAIRALGVTDYYLLDTYDRVRNAKHRDRRLPGVDLVFPNIELRLAFGTVKGNWVNCHLLVNPQDPDHVGATKRFLAELTFEYSGDRFACTPDELMRLGWKIDSKRRDPRHCSAMASINGVSTAIRRCQIGSDAAGLRGLAVNPKRTN